VRLYFYLFLDCCWPFQMFFFFSSGIHPFSSNVYFFFRGKIRRN
jgi:hypothetical protein